MASHLQEHKEALNTETSAPGSLHCPTHSTSSKGDEPDSYVDKVRAMKLRYEPSFEKKEKLEQLKEALNIKRSQQHLTAHTSLSAPSSNSLKIYIMAPLPITKSYMPTSSNMTTLKIVAILKYPPKRLHPWARENIPAHTLMNSPNKSGNTKMLRSPSTDSDEKRIT